MNNTDSTQNKPSWSLGRIFIAIGYIGLMAFPTFYWFDQDHFNDPDWHIHARFHILWKTVLMTMGGVTGLWLTIRHWSPSIARTIARWVPVVIWTTHFLCHFIMSLITPENAFPHHTDHILGITVADLAIGIVLLLGIAGAIMDRRNE